ncbi:hypothetical protein AB0A95_02240 [Micromonospora sp. NPDC049230]
MSGDGVAGGRRGSTTGDRPPGGVHSRSGRLGPVGWRRWKVAAWT